MKFTINKASDYDYKDTKEFNTLEELLQFILEQEDIYNKEENVKDFGGIILSHDEDGWYIEIYDYYVE